MKTKIFFLLISLGFISAVRAQAQRNVAAEAANKKLVLTFYQKLFGDKDLSAIDEYISDKYIQHNPQIADGKVALKKAVTLWFKGAPKEKVDIPQAAAEDNLVFLHVRTKGPQGQLRAIVEIFRIENHRIAEHWDVIQDATATSVNKHPLF